MERLQALPALADMTLAGCPLARQSSYRVTVAAALPQLKARAGGACEAASVHGRLPRTAAAAIPAPKIGEETSSRRLLAVQVLDDCDVTAAERADAAVALQAMPVLAPGILSSSGPPRSGPPTLTVASMRARFELAGGARLAGAGTDGLRTHEPYMRQLSTLSAPLWPGV